MRPFLWLLLPGLFAVSPLRAADPPPVNPEIRRLLPDDFWASDPADRIELGGSAIGGAATPAAFYLAARAALEKSGADEATWLELSKHRNLCVRVVGLAGLAEKGTPAAIPRIKELLSSREGETGMTIGCLPSKLFESLVAFQFLTSTEFLCLRRPVPLLSGKESLALAFEVLYRDECAGAREPGFDAEEISAPALLVSRAIAGGRLRLRMDELTAASSSLQAHQIVKAAGRLPPQLATPFLIETLHDARIAAASRLAAASALARQQSHSRGSFEREALLAAKDALDKLDSGQWGSSLSRLSHSDWNWHYPRWPVTTENDKAAGRFVLDDSIAAWSAWALEPSRPNDKKPLVISWEELPAFLRQYAAVYARWRADWNAFGDTLYRLELRLRHVEQYGGREIEAEETTEAVLKAVKLAQEAKAVPK